MALDEITRDQLQQAARLRTREAAAALLEGDDRDGAKANLAWAETAREVLRADKAASPHRLYLTVVIAVICLTLTVFAWTLSPGDNLMTFDAQLEGLDLKLVRQWNLEPDLPLAHFSIDRLAQVQSATTGLQRPKRISLTAGAQGVRLKQLEFAAGSRMTLEADESGLRIFVYQGEVRGQLAVAEGDLALSGEGERQVQQLQASGPSLPNIAPPPALLEFASRPLSDQGPPLELVLETDADWHFALVGAAAEAFGFQREYPRDSGLMVSTIRQGEGRFVETEREFNLQDGDELRLDDALSARLILQRAEGAMRLGFLGTADEVEAGPRGFEKDLTPTWLEYLYNNQQLTVVWTALVFLWGIAWRLRGLW